MNNSQNTTLNAQNQRMNNKYGFNNQGFKKVQPFLSFKREEKKS